ncbi:MAG TPA: hypothetical protein VFM18_07700 [Methanosarcina sp.]|nr:hypothetical protein [Methanosarcina sp.]
MSMKFIRVNSVDELNSLLSAFFGKTHTDQDTSSTERYVHEDVSLARNSESAKAMVDSLLQRIKDSARGPIDSEVRISTEPVDIDLTDDFNEMATVHDSNLEPFQRSPINHADTTSEDYANATITVHVHGLRSSVSQAAVIIQESINADIDYVKNKMELSDLQFNVSVTTNTIQ